MTARRRTIGWVGAALVTALMAAGCSAGGSDSKAGSNSAAGGPALSEPQVAAPEQGAGDQAAGPAKDVPAQSPDLSVDQRAIVYTGSITIRVQDVNAAAAKATAIVAGTGGFVSGDRRDINGDSSTATMELRVPAEKFHTVVDALAKQLGTEEQREISTEDVTEQTVDLDARITVQQARVDSGRKLLAQAKTLSDLVMLEKEVATRESDLASLQAKKRRLADLTALSTITVVLLDPGAPATKPDKGPPGFLAGLSGGWHALLASLGVVLTALGALLPWLIVVGGPVWALIWAFRRWARTRRRPGPILSPAGTAPGLSPYGAVAPPAPAPSPAPAAAAPDRPDPISRTAASPAPAAAAPETAAPAAPETPAPAAPETSAPAAPSAAAAPTPTATPAPPERAPDEG